MSAPISPLHKDVACRKNLLWGTELDHSVSAEHFIEALELRGFTIGHGAIPGLAILDHESGHRVVFIARTGRIQLRLDALTTHEQRIPAAEQLYETVRLAACGARGQADASPDATGQPCGSEGGNMDAPPVGE